MRKNGTKWVLGTLSIAAVAFSAVLISNSSYAQEEDETRTEEIQVEDNVDMPEACIEHAKSMKDGECTYECAPEECESACPQGECEDFCKSAGDKSCGTTVDPGSK
jgi:hypothetical protein